MWNKKERIETFKTIMLGHRISLDFTDYLIDEGFFTAPASTKYHGNYEGGLFDHSYKVAERLVDITEKMGLDWKNPRSPYIVGMFHDLCKIDNYKKVIDEEGFLLMGSDETQGEVSHFEHNTEIFIPGHGDKSVMILSRWMQLTEEEILCIRYHMGAYETKDWDFYGRAIEKYPNVLWTHTADMYAAKVLGI